jgi:hypothetical protein
MDVKTINKIIKMLDEKTNTIKLNQPVPIIKDWHNGLVHGLEEFREHLRKLTVIHTDLQKEE